MLGPLSFPAVHFENPILATKSYAVLKIEDLKKKTSGIASIQNVRLI